VRESDFKAQYLCEFKPDERFEKLVAELQGYYDATADSVNNKDAAKLWRKFSYWARDNGYDHDEINRAKRICLN